MASLKIIESGLTPVNREELIKTHVAKINGLLAELSVDILRELRKAENEALARLNKYVPTDRLLSLKEAAAYLRMSPRTLDEGTRPGRESVMPFLLQGGRKKFRKASLDAELDRMEVTPREVNP